jgi:hypothetical protein
VSDHWHVIDSTVIQMLQQELATPQPEPEYKVRVGRVERFETFSKFRIVMLVGTARDTLLRQVLGRRVDSLAAGDFGLFRVPNPWQQGQTVLIFVARDTGLLVRGLEAYAARIRQELEEIVLEQMRRAVYIEGINTELTGRLAQRFAFSVDVPARWQVREEFADSGFVYMFVHYPDRSVFVYWSGTLPGTAPESLAMLRDRLTGRYYKGDSIDPLFTTVDTVEFLSRPATRLRGVWRNEKTTIGGPFVTYAFEYQDRFYMVDGLLFEPGKKKLDHLLQVEAVVRSFTPK